jgi:hypothetical protein
MRSVLMLVLIIFSPGLAAQDQVLHIRAELVWVASQAEDHRLMYSQLTGNEWSDPLAIYDSKSVISTPTISTDQSQNKLIIWSEQSKKAMVLMSARRAFSETIWQPAEKLNNFKAENLSPSIVIDSRNRPWVFWSSNYEGLDDIYYSRQEGTEWSPPAKVHNSNDVPDYQPVASLNKDLDVVVSWTTYDRQASQYLTAQEVFMIDNLSKSAYKSPLNKKLQESIPKMILPDFLPMDSSVVLHFPNNRIEQSVRLDLNR